MPSTYCLTTAATDAAKQWDGWGTALKPAMEPITVARKPLTGTVAANALEHGVGALNIDGCRIGEDNGHWPANVIHDGSEEVMRAFPDAPGQQRATGPEFDRNAQVYGKFAGVAEHEPRGDSGSAARFFYCAKASSEERNKGLKHFEKHDRSAIIGQLHAGTSAAGNTTGNYLPRANVHPTVKPVDLMRYLVRLVTPPGGTVLDPFMGSGTTGCACKMEGFDFIGIDREAQYVDIARARIAAHHFEPKQGDLFGAPPASPFIQLEIDPAA